MNAVPSTIVLGVGEVNGELKAVGFFSEAGQLKPVFAMTLEQARQMREKLTQVIEELEERV